MEITQTDNIENIENKKYLTTEAHRNAYYKYYNTHKKELFDKKKNKYANNEEFKQKILFNNRQYYERNKDTLIKKSNDRIKKKIENPDYKRKVLQKQKEYNIKNRLWHKTIKELYAISIFDE